jgi:fatty acid desaturase
VNNDRASSLPYFLLQIFYFKLLLHLSGGAEKEKGSRTPEMITILVFWAAHRLAALACQGVTWLYNNLQ